MSLPAGQQRALDGIAETLRLTEPRLTAMFAMFTRLTRNEPRPGREEVTSLRRRGWLGSCVRRLSPRPGKRGGPGWRRLAIIGQLALAFVVFGVLVGLGARATATCGAAQRSPADPVRATAVVVSRHQACPATRGSSALPAGK